LSQKKLASLFIILSTLLISILPITNIIIKKHNKTLDMTNLTKEELFTTDHLESNINYLAYKIFNTSMIKMKTIVGKDGFLFLGNLYASVIDKAQGKYKYDPKELSIWADKLKKIEKWYADRGIEFLLVIAPNKSSIYPDKLPSSIIYKKGKTITDDIVKLAKDKNITMLDLRDRLRKHRDDGMLYFKTDTHWNNLGSSIGYQATIEFLNKRYNEHYIMPKYTMIQTREGSGDLANFLKIKDMLPKDFEINYLFSFEHDTQICHGYIDPTDFSLKDCKPTANRVVNIYAKDQYIINKNATNHSKLLLVADSFSTANSMPYNATFSTLWKLHQSRLYGKKLSSFVEKNRPDIVIYQIVERDLYTQKIVEPL